MARKKSDKIIEKIKEEIKEIPEKVEDKAVELVRKVEENIEKTGEKIIKEVADKIKEKKLQEQKIQKEKPGKSKKVDKKEQSGEQDNISDNDNLDKKSSLNSEDKKAKLAKLLKKAKELEKKVEEIKPIDIKKKVKPEEEEKETLVPMEDYLKASIHLGTRVITPDMRQYVYRRRADGLAVFNTALLDDKIREGADFLTKFAPEDVILICKREAGWKAANKFSEITSIKTFTKKYPAGILTNPNLENFMETDLVFICDPWLDKNALEDANRIKIPVLSVCDTNNFTKGVTKVIPGNNKSAKSLGIIFFLLSKIYIEKRKLSVKIPEIKEFIDDWDILVPPK